MAILPMKSPPHLPSLPCGIIKQQSHHHQKPRKTKPSSPPQPPSPKPRDEDIVGYINTGYRSKVKKISPPTDQMNRRPAVLPKPKPNTYKSTLLSPPAPVYAVLEEPHMAVPAKVPPAVSKKPPPPPPKPTL